jgi:glycosyltransferase involved in cell wall biosynthesis
MMASVRWYNASAAYAVELAAALRDRGHAVRLVVQPGSPVETEARARGLEVQDGFDLTARGPAPALARIRELKGLIETFRPDVLNPHRSEDHLFGVMALRGTPIPLVRTRGDVRPPRNHLANRILYRRATKHHIGTADFMPERFFTPMGIEPGRVTVIRPGFDTDDFRRGAPEPRAAREQLGLPPDGPWIGSIGRFTAAKGHHVLLAAFAGSISEGRLLLSGSENEIPVTELRGEAARLGVADRVHVLPRVEDVRVALRALDVLAVPSVASEAIARIAIEGLALGIPTVASDLNSLPEVVGDAGRIVPPGNAEALGAAMAGMLADPRFRDRAAQAGPDRIRRRYARDEQVRRTEALMNRLIGGDR